MNGYVFPPLALFILFLPAYDDRPHQRDPHDVEEEKGGGENQHGAMYPYKTLRCEIVLQKPLTAKRVKLLRRR